MASATSAADHSPASWPYRFSLLSVCRQFTQPLFRPPLAPSVLRPLCFMGTSLSTHASLCLPWPSSLLLPWLLKGHFSPLSNCQHLVIFHQLPPEDSCLDGSPDRHRESQTWLDSFPLVSPRPASGPWWAEHHFLYCVRECVSLSVE